PFKPAGFPGRKGNSQRVLVMELFTGAQCPPCVAADAAFDALETTYKPADVILLQYHMHIPGPDPLTNPDSEARMRYYSKKFPRDAGGTPSTIFNGKANSLGGGGLLAQSERKYHQYREHIDKLLEETTPVHLNLTAGRKGDHINLKAEVSELSEPGE